MQPIIRFIYFVCCCCHLFCITTSAAGDANSTAVAKATEKLRLNATMPRVIVASNFNASKKSVSILFSINYSGQVLNLGPVCTESARLALESSKTVLHNLVDYEIVVEPYEDQCVRALMVQRFIALMEQNGASVHRFPLSLGPLCAGQQHPGMMIENYNFIGLAASSPQPEITKFRRWFPNYFTLARTLENSFVALASFLQTMDWKNIVIIGESTQPNNDVETILINAMDRVNGSKISVAKFPYVSGVPPDSDQIRDALDQVRSLNARIFIIQSFVASRVACWLHRYKMYGPNYVFLLLTGYAFSPADPIRFRDWCTEQMLRDVLQSVFLFGPTNEINLYGANTSDSTGMTGKLFEETMKERIERPETSPIWWFWRTACYDNVLTAVHLLDEIEGQLRKKRNETLSDWFVNGRLFRNNGEKIVEIMKDSLYSVRLKTLTNEIAFERRTQTNTGGLTVVAIFQLQNVMPVAVAASNKDGNVRLVPGQLKWRTASGRAPIDGVRTVRVLGANFSEEVYITMIALSSLELLAVFVSAVCLVTVHKTKLSIKNSVPSLTMFILLGDALFQGFTLVQPWKSFETSNINCMVGYGFLIIGLACLIYGMAAKLTLAGTLLNSSQQRQRADRKTKTILAMSFENQVKISVHAGLIFVAFCSALTIYWLASDPFINVIVSSPLEPSTTDDSLAFQHFYYECRFGKTSVTKAIASVLFALYGAMLLRSGFLAYITRSTDFKQIVDCRAVANCLYGTVVMLGCGGIIAGAIFQDQPTSMRISISFALLACSALNLCLLLAPKLMTANDSFANLSRVSSRASSRPSNFQVKTTSIQS